MTPNESVRRSLTRLRQMVALPASIQADDMDLQLVDYTLACSKHDPRDVEAACLHWAETQRWWPALADLLQAVRDCKFNREARQRAAAESRKLADVTGATDYWSLHHMALGTGLLVLQGQILLEGLDKNSAADWFNEAVAKIGFEQAKSIANAAYTPGHHGAILPAIMAASGLPKPKVRAPWVDVERLAERVKREHDESQDWYRKHNAEHGRRLDATFQELERKLAAGDRAGLIPDMRERVAA